MVLRVFLAAGAGPGHSQVHIETVVVSILNASTSRWPPRHASPPLTRSGCLFPQLCLLRPLNPRLLQRCR